MTSIKAEYLTRHYEQYLANGKQEEFKSYLSRGEGGTFRVLQFADQPEPGLNTLVTFGLSAAQVALGPKPFESGNIELLICAEASFEPIRLAATLMALGRMVLDERQFRKLHGVVPGEGPVHDNPLFEHFYVTNPGYFPAGFDQCTSVSPPIEILQVLPISSGERDIIATNGWSAFEDAASEQDIDFALYDGRPEVRGV